MKELRGCREGDRLKDSRRRNRGSHTGRTREALELDTQLTNGVLCRVVNRIFLVNMTGVRDANRQQRHAKKRGGPASGEKRPTQASQ